MDKRKVEEWLDKLIEAIRNYEDVRVLCGEISANPIGSYEVSVQNLRMVADIMEIPLSERDWNYNGSAANHISMHYKGVTFYELENYKERGK